MIQSDKIKMATIAKINPIIRIGPGITLYITRDKTMVISGTRPVSGTTIIALP